MANMKDFATALIVTAPSPDTSGTSLVIETGKGVRMPAVPFKATASPVGQLPTLDNAEKVIVTNITGDTLTIIRAQGGTTAQAITGSGAWRLSNTIFAEDMDLSGLVPKTTTINAKPLNGDISLTSSDIGAAASLHTHTAADTTDFDTEVSNNTDVAANTAARHTHANSAVLNATTASFTTADETKLDGIAAGAQVNTVTSVNTRTGAVTGLAEASDLTAHTGNTSNPHGVTKAQVGLGNVDNTSDVNKPVSTAQQTALNAATFINPYTVPFRNSPAAGPANDFITVTQTAATADSMVRRTSTGAVFAATATDNNHAVNKAQMDTANALKVNKAGDTITGRLDSTLSTGNGFQQARTKTIQWGVNSTGQFNIYNATDLTSMSDFDPAGTGFSIGSWNAGVRYLKGTGFPEGVISAPVGSTYIDTAITNGASSWIKKSGTGSTGWQVLEGDTGWRNISSLLTNGWTGSLYIKRTASDLSIHVEGVSSSAAANGTIAALPSGFVPSTVSGIGINRNFVSTASGPASMYRVTISSGGGVIIQNFSTGMGTMYGTMHMSIADAYPTTLPGTAA